MKKNSYFYYDAFFREVEDQVYATLETGGIVREIKILVMREINIPLRHLKTILLSRKKT